MENPTLRIEKLKKLSNREREVLVMVCRGGRTYKQIAEHLVIEETTVQFHMNNVYRKLDLVDLRKADRQRELGKFCSALSSLEEGNRVVGESVAESEAEAKELPEPPATLQKSEDDTQPTIFLDEDVVGGQEIANIVDLPLSQSSSRRLWKRGWFVAVVTIGIAVFTGLALVISISNPSPVPPQVLPTSVATNPTTISSQIASPTSPTAAPQPTISSATPSPIAVTPRPEPTAPLIHVCGEADRQPAPDAVRFLRSQGVSNFTQDNTKGAVLSDWVRALAIDQRGLWIGYFATDANHRNGVGQYDKKTWAACNQPEELPGRDVNAIAIDQDGRVWAATESTGVLMFDGQRWRTYTTENSLPSNKTYGLTIDKNNAVWVGTWEGVAKFDGERWETTYTAENNTIFNDHVHAIAFDSSSNIWIGHIQANGGVSEYRAAEGKWIHHLAGSDEIGGNQIRSIVVRKADTSAPESIWFATADGGISKYEKGKWAVYSVNDGLPSSDVRAVAIDKYNRVWAATSRGVSYFDGKNWIRYNSLDTSSITFGPSCQACPFADDVIWTGTVDHGLTHSRLPYPDVAIDVLKACFISAQREASCQTLTTVDQTNVMTVTYSRTVTPDEVFRFEITVSPRSPYQLLEKRGDFLSNTDESDANLFGAYPIIAVKGTIDPGQPFTFTDFDNPFKVPQLAEGEQEKTFVSTWRVWMYTRYVGPYIRLEFTVRKP